MTEITKPLKRRTRTVFAHYRKRIVITLEPGDVIALSLERNRTKYRVTIDDLFVAAARWTADASRREKKARRK